MLLLALAAAGLLGVFALVANYVSDVDTRVGPNVSVLVLTKDAKKNEAISDDMMTEVIKTHPKMLFGGMVVENPTYVPPK